MPSSETDWSAAFLRQAGADLDAYTILAASRLPSCQRLHFLQMWLEKLTKAYLWSDLASASYPPDFRTTHNVVAKVLPSLVREFWSRLDARSTPSMNELRDLCREIDRLHPQVDDDGRRPDNVEYP